MWKKLLILFTCLLLFGCSQQKPTIYIIASYDEQDVCGAPQVESVKDALKELKDFSIKEFYLDARRLSKEQMQERCDRVAQEIKTTKNLKAIITIDDAAMQCAAKHFMGKKVPVVFSGINITPEEYNKKYQFLKGRTPIKNFTGVYEYLFIKRQFALLEILVKDVKNIAVLYSTDLVGETLKNQVLDEIKATPYNEHHIMIELFFIQYLTLKNWIRQ
ncbi:ABC transporter substrate binding protein [Thermodesulfovibrio hydrogeniphilus]